MIVEPGQFQLRIEQLSEAFDLDAGTVDAAQSIRFNDPIWKVDARIKREGEGPFEPVRMIRKRTEIFIYGEEEALLWSNVKDINPSTADASKTRPKRQKPHAKRDRQGGK